MKNQLILLALALIFAGTLFAKPVEINTAKQAGEYFLRYKTKNGHVHAAQDLVLAYTASSDPSSVIASDDVIVYFYIFNTVNGFVIVSGDDCVLPVLGYSDEKPFRTYNIARGMAKWLEGYKSQIRFAITHHLAPTEEIENAWAELKKTTQDISSTYNPRNSVDPLVQTKWDQPAPYNELCPGGSVTGCVATAMAQIMKYWNHPANGMGFHSFDHDNYGTLSANFGSTTYNWGSMPNTITSSNNAIATLMYHCGVSVNMGYSPEVSGAWVIENSPTPQACSEFAFKTYFGYENTLSGIERENYSDAQWETTLRAELDAGRPILYDGFGNGGGHAFVCDGYDDNSFFHYNWGWSGYYDGYFETSALNPGGTGTGGGTGGYNSGQEVIIGIKPPGGGTPSAPTLELYDALYMSTTNVVYGAGFELYTNILNAGSVNFSGDYSAAIFDHNLNFVDFIEVKSGWTLTAGFVYNDGITFSTAGSYSILPGTYYAAVFYRHSGGDWTIVGNGDYLNVVEFEISFSNLIELYSDITLSPGTTLEKGKAASVNLNILNDGNFTFTGTYSVDLYDLYGNWIENIGQLNEDDGLPPGFLYLDPFLNFSTSSITADPGTYLLALTHQWEGYDWELTGSSYFANPVYVTVKAPAPKPDIYEDNNSVAQAYNLSLNFSGNMAEKTTAGSDCHTGSDYDFYQIDLPAGFDYTLNMRLHDSYNSGNGNTYTLDGQFSFSGDGVNWSESFDDIIPGQIIVPGGGTLYLFATPYFLGQTGTYLLDLNITRTEITGVYDEWTEPHIKVFPNPVGDVIHVDLSAAERKFDRVSLVTNLGIEVYHQDITNNTKITMHVNDLSEGNYFILLRSEEGMITRKVMISR